MLVVEQRPGAAYRLAMRVSGVAAVVGLAWVALQDALAMAGLVLTVPIGVLVMLLAAWRETSCRIDRRTGLLVVTEWGLLRPGSAREFSLGAAAGVVDRRYGPRRSIEVVLADEALVPVADARGTDASAPLRVGTDEDWAQVAAGGSFTCARKTNGELHCFGDDMYGKLGLGDTNNRGDAGNEMGDYLPEVSLW